MKRKAAIGWSIGIIGFFAVFATLCFVGIANSAISSVFNLSFYVFNINSMVYVWIGCIAFGTSLLGSIIPILHYCNKTPKNVVKL